MHAFFSSGHPDRIIVGTALSGGTRLARPLRTCNERQGRHRPIRSPSETVTGSMPESQAAEMTHRGTDRELSPSGEAHSCSATPARNDVTPERSFRTTGESRRSFRSARRGADDQQTLACATVRIRRTC